MGMGVVLGAIGNSLSGFCPLFKIPHELEFIWIGITLLGMAVSLINVPFMPYIIDYYEEHPS